MIWIDTKKEKPKEGEYVLIYLADDNYDIAYWDDFLKKWETHEDTYWENENKVTHWARVIPPKPPKQSED